MPADRQLFVHLPVADPDAATAFFARLGFAVDERFTDASCACLVVAGDAYVLLRRDPAAAAHAATLGVSAADRADVDRIADAALRHGGASAGPAVDHGCVYGRSFRDPDGHRWEITWMDPAAIEPDPAAPAAGAAP